MVLHKKELYLSNQDFLVQIYLKELRELQEEVALHLDALKVKEAYSL